MFDTFIFDFDLTLADSSKGILECFKHTLSYFGFEIPDDKTIYNTIGLTLEQAFEKLTGVNDEEKLAHMRTVYVKKADEVMVKYTVFYDGAINGLEKLRNKGFKVGIVSTKYRYRIEDSFKNVTDACPVDFIIGGEDVKKHKPDPSGLELCIEKLGSLKENVLYVGDSFIDAQTAQNAKVSFGGVLTGSTTMEMFRSYDYKYLCKDVSELIEKLIIS